MTKTKATAQAGETLPVYEVTRTGLDEAQAKKLAEAFVIPADQIVLRDGVVTYVDRAGYLNIPTTEVSDPDIAQKLRGMSGSGSPDTRLRLESLDLAALEKLPGMDQETALRKTAEAFAAAGLPLESARPVTGHTKLTVSFVDGDRRGSSGR